MSFSFQGKRCGGRRKSMMNQVVDFRSRGNFIFCSISRTSSSSSLKTSQTLCFYPRNTASLKKKKCSESVLSAPVNVLVDRAANPSAKNETVFDVEELYTFPHIQYLKNFPRDELSGKVVMVRFDAMILLQGMGGHQLFPANVFFTVKYLYEAEAKVILVGSWNEDTSSSALSKACPSTETVADFLSSVLELEVLPVKHFLRHKHSDFEDRKNSAVLLLENLFHFKEERANCSKFAKELASRVDIIVNDALSESHKVLASTVGVASFTCAYIAGFYFEEGLDKLKNIVKTTERPYVAIVGGGCLASKAAALHALASVCDGLIFVGSMAFQIMHVLGVPIPTKLLDLRGLKEASMIVEYAKLRNIPLVLPRDVWCIKDHCPDRMKLFSLYSILQGWQPVDIGPKSLQEMIKFLSECKKIVWVGALRFSPSKLDKGGIPELAKALSMLSSCDITFVGNLEQKLIEKSKLSTNFNFVTRAAVVWEVLKGRKLPGLMALDRAYPFQIDWNVTYGDPVRPLVVDVGSGNGLFLFGMARRRKDMNFLGIEMNAKLVDHCLHDIHRLSIDNVHFIATNATSTFRPIVSSYPGELFLVSVQCPNPDFNKPEHRWRMLQKSLVEAIADMLIIGGKVFLQSDIEAVAVRMKKEFTEHSKGKLVIMENHADVEVDKQGWLKENPFGVPSDWEKHVLFRGDSMYRILLSKV